MAIYRVTAEWRGFLGAPGYSNFYFTEVPSDPGPEAGRNRVIAFMNGINPVLPSDVEYFVQGEVATVDENTGLVTDYDQLRSDVSPGTGGMSGPYSAASGAVISWMTPGVRNGRRVQGRTFIVPLGGSAYQADGTLASSTIDTLGDAAEELVGADFESGFSVWSRPGSAGDGEVWPVNAYRIPDMSAVLRSRRD